MGTNRLSITALLVVLASATTACTGDGPDTSTAGATVASTSPQAPEVDPSSPTSSSVPPGPTALRGEVVLSDAGAPIEAADFGPGSHAVIEVWRLEYDVADTATETIASVTVDDVTAFPIPFQFADDLGIEPPRPGTAPEYEYGARATVYLGEADDQPYAGDPITVNRFAIENPADHLVLTVFRFEECGRDAFGHCAAPERPD